jgi:hypothetical protein
MKLSKIILLLASAALITAPASLRADQPSPAALVGFNRYVSAVQQHRSAEPVLDASQRGRLRAGGVDIERLTPKNEDKLPGALLHHWRGSAFVVGATTADFDRVMRNYSAYPSVFSPEVLTAQLLERHDNDYDVILRVRQKHVLTVVLDTAYHVTFADPDARHASSFSRSTRVTEIASPATRNEHPLSPAESHGYLWALDTWWTAEQADGGLYLQVESVSLTRSIPTGLGWMIGPYIESVPRESLAFTLQSVCRALRH